MKSTTNREQVPCFTNKWVSVDRDHTSCIGSSTNQEKRGEHIKYRYVPRVNGELNKYKRQDFVKSVSNSTASKSVSTETRSSKSQHTAVPDSSEEHHDCGSVVSPLQTQGYTKLEQSSDVSAGSCYLDYSREPIMTAYYCEDNPSLRPNCEKDAFGRCQHISYVTTDGKVPDHPGFQWAVPSHIRPEAWQRYPATSLLNVMRQINLSQLRLHDNNSKTWLNNFVMKVSRVLHQGVPVPIYTHEKVIYTHNGSEVWGFKSTCHFLGRTASYMSDTIKDADIGAADGIRSIIVEESSSTGKVSLDVIIGRLSQLSYEMERLGVDCSGCQVKSYVLAGLKAIKDEFTKDLTTEGIEPNPGPGCLNRGSTHALLPTPGSTVGVDCFLLDMTVNAGDTLAVTVSAISNDIWDGIVTCYVWWQHSTGSAFVPPDNSSFASVYPDTSGAVLITRSFGMKGNFYNSTPYFYEKVAVPQFPWAGPYVGRFFICFQSVGGITTGKSVYADYAYCPHQTSLASTNVNISSINPAAHINVMSTGTLPVSVLNNPTVSFEGVQKVRLVADDLATSYVSTANRSGSVGLVTYISNTVTGEGGGLGDVIPAASVSGSVSAVYVTNDVAVKNSLTQPSLITSGSTSIPGGVSINSSIESPLYCRLSGTPGVGVNQVSVMSSPDVNTFPGPVYTSGSGGGGTASEVTITGINVDMAVGPVKHGSASSYIWAVPAPVSGESDNPIMSVGGSEKDEEKSSSDGGWYSSWFSSRQGSTVTDNSTSAEEIAARNHNKDMHSKNGNTSIDLAESKSDEVLAIIHSGENPGTRYVGQRCLGMFHQNCDDASREYVARRLVNKQGFDIDVPDLIYAHNSTNSTRRVTNTNIKNNQVWKKKKSSSSGSGSSENQSTGPSGYKAPSIKYNIREIDTGKKNNMLGSVRRIAGDLKNIPNLVYYTLKNDVDPKFAKMLCDAMSVDFSKTNLWTRIMYGVVNERPSRITWESVVEFFPAVLDYSNTKPDDWQLAMSYFFGSDKEESLSEISVHESVEHGTNPNDTVEDFLSVDALGQEYKHDDNSILNNENSNPTGDNSLETVEHNFGDAIEFQITVNQSIYTMYARTDQCTSEVYSYVSRATDFTSGSFYLTIGSGGRPLNEGRIIGDYDFNSCVQITLVPKILGGSATWLSSDIKEISSCGSLDNVAGGSTSMGIDAVFLDSRITGLQSPYQIGSTLASKNGNYYTRYWDSTNVLGNNGNVVCTNLPEHRYEPRTVRVSGTNALQFATHRLHVVDILAEDHAAPVSVSLSMSATMAIEMGARQGIRPGSMSMESNLRIDDVARLGNIAVDQVRLGTSLVAPFLRGYLLASTLADQAELVNGRFNTMGMANGVQMDPLTQLSAAQPNPQVTVNSAADLLQFGESCGGLAAVFPVHSAINGGGGIIRFHQTLETVPDVSQLLFMNSNLVQIPSGGVNRAINYAYLALLFSHYPSCMRAFHYTTSNEFGVNIADQIFVHHANQIAINGSSVIDILCPITGSAPRPTDQVSANSNVWVRPRSGPIAVPALPVDSDLDINFVGGAVVSYNLCQFLRSWADQMSFSGLTSFIDAFSREMGSEQDRQAAQEMSLVLTNWYSPMQCAYMSAAANKVGYNTTIGSDTTLYNSVSIKKLTESIPATSSRSYDFVIPNCSFLYVTLVLSNVISPITSGSPTPNSLACFSLSQNVSMLSKYVTRSYAAAEDLYFKLWRVPASLWNMLSTNTDLLNLRTEMLKTYIQGNDEYGYHVAANSYLKYDIMSEYVGFTCSRASCGYSLFDFQLYPGDNRYLGFIDIAATGYYKTVIPCLLNDSFLYLTLKKIPKEFQLWPRPNEIHNNGLNTQFSGSSYGIQVLLIGGVQNYTMPAPLTRVIPKLRTNEFPVYDSDEIYNMRLGLAGLTGMGLFMMGGQVVPDVPPSATAIGSFMCQVFPKQISGDYTSGIMFPLLQPFSCSTWIPTITPTGSNILMSSVYQGASVVIPEYFSGRKFFSIPSIQYSNREIIPMVVISGGLESKPKFLTRGKGTSGGVSSDREADPGDGTTILQPSAPDLGSGAAMTTDV